MTTVFSIVGIIYLLSFWFDLMNSIIARQNFANAGWARMKNTYEPFRFFVVSVYTRFFKKDKPQSVG